MRAISFHFFNSCGVCVLLILELVFSESVPKTEFFVLFLCSIVLYDISIIIIIFLEVLTVCAILKFSLDQHNVIDNICSWCIF